MNKKVFLSLALATSMFTATAQQVAPAIPRDEKIEQQVEAWLQKMTLEEKIGQMCELTIDVLQQRTNPFEGLNMENLKVADLQKILKKYGIEKEFDLSGGIPDKDVMMKIYMRIQGIESQKGFQLSEAMLDSVIGKYKVGSILNVPNGKAQTVQKWQEIIKRIQEKSMEEIGIPCIYGVDQIHGTTYTLGGTFFPQGVNMGATFNRELTRRGAEISAYETKAGSIPWTYAPVTDLGRDPRWPRMWENYGEDCYLNAEMGREAVLGYQGNDPNHIGDNSVAACMKHYMGYGVPVSGKDRTPSSITEQDMREKHFAPYLEMVKNGALSVMVNSAMNNGLPFHANYELLTEWLKNDLNWDGMIVTDWADINNLYSRDHIAKDKKEAIKLAINAGIDMSMDPYDWKFCTLLKELVEEGEVPMSRIDDAVRRVLRLKYRLNLFEKPYYDLKDFPLFGSAEHAAAALKAAEESLVLLKNTDGILPLAKGKKILLTGPNANSMRSLNGGWSYTWQGSNAEDCSEPYNTILEAFTNKFGAENIIYEAGVTYNEKGNWWDENAPEIEKAVAAAAQADYIVACIGENSYCETPGNLTDLTLSENQRNLVKALAKTGKPIILVLNEGRPRIIADIEPLSKAVVNVMLPGNYGGDALANLVAGDSNFSGKMPYTYPKEINSLITYDYKPCEHIGKQMEGAYNYDAVVNVQWAFGYGLSYTTFAYSNLKVDKTSFTADDVLTFTVDVKNTGNRVGKESVLLFSSDLVASLTPDNRRLRAFDKVELQPGETKTVTLKVKGSDLAFVGYDGKWILEEGDFRMQVGDQVVGVACSQTKKWDTPNK
ncbi:glycoside hydrolase family 3 N-terminal domain-containing protein [Phocaeicola barnesiae]|mgnify:FL=1|jgi:beta-glucosidase|uniref:beta-glucosidase n=1 Tax=Phocaeicola barnesiae TaxID=376804 RepID=A0AAW5N642_9BACT|nr:glycoside hydrolase family 3 N-terminal domain-containing protein [Phocaeicola barnesiae]MCR8874273.1 glycoside hydrolase family 3 C-terminal domain-containing protein [Phocaeicola barnesiae]MDM8233157.1 glycoside hydrolase family 3 N-terminal domain-containing protein [Phocaeicola barnesiae]MDM8252450.1 glycoside hydrolase family 3 N-terminal domain-containing protein [Phocaeicola barnesiae]MDM8254642.1 glycoside hydrolase family 3 N-terminal domain-containing protein [Phocaeicola barnesiae